MWSSSRESKAGARAQPWGGGASGDGNLRGSGGRISGGEASNFAAQLPEELKGPLQAATGDPESFGLENFFERVAGKVGVSKNKATEQASAVMAVLGRAITSGELRDVRSQLPREFHPLLQG